MNGMIFPMSDFEPFSESHLHHPWCNLFMRPREGCPQCEGLFERYPCDPEDDGAALVAEHFPDVVVRTPPQNKENEDA